MKKMMLLLAVTIGFYLSAAWIEIPENSRSKLFEYVAGEIESVELEFSLNGYELEEIYERGDIYQKISYSNEGELLEIGKPDLPVFSRLVAVPNEGEVSVEILSYESEIISDILIFPQQELQIDGQPRNTGFVIDEDFYISGSVFPEKNVNLGIPAIIRDHRIVNITVNPFQYDPVNRELTIIKNLDFKINCSGQNGENVKIHNRKKSRFFESIYASTIVNYESLRSRDDEYQKPSYLFIYPTSSPVQQNLQLLTNWKHQKGFKVTVASTTETGTTLNSIKNYIQDAYDNWEDPPEFVCLVGDANGSFVIPTGNYSGPGDQYYTLLEGDDILADIFIGRLSFNTILELQTIIAKILGYEKEPYLGEQNWYQEALLVGDPSSSEQSCIITNKYIKELINADEDGYTFDEIYSGSFASGMNNSINDGVNYFNYRGYIGMSGWGNSNINSLTNGFKLPVAVILTCSTGGFDSGWDDCRSELLLKAGSPTVPKGAIAAIGTATSTTHTCFNNCVDMGIFYGIFVDHIFHMGGALNRGKLNLYLNYPQNPNNSVYKFSYWNNLMGDPGMEVWTNVPQEMNVTYESQIPYGSNYMNVSIKDTDENPIEGAWVTAQKGEDIIFSIGFTDESGNLTLPFASETLGDVNLTVTKHNFIPHLGSFELVQSDVFPNVYEIEIDDDNSDTSSGNGDGIINPGEVIELNVALKNYGTLSATGIYAEISSTSEFVEITDASEIYGTIEPGTSIFSEDDFDLSINPDIVDGTEILINIVISDDNENQWNDTIILTTDGANLQAHDYEIMDANNILDPGETAELVVTIENLGSISATGISGILTSPDNRIYIDDANAYFGDALSGEQISNNSDTFELTASSHLIPGTLIIMNLNLTDENGYNANTSFVLEVGEASVTDPLGPDGYGYYCYDNGDTGYQEVPIYNWIEIDPDYGGSGTVISLYDYGDTGDIEILDLPFTFQFYGEPYDQITVCTNGWISPGITEQYSFMNWHVPGPGGPSPMIAPLWDDLKTGGGHVCYFYDPVENYFVVEWSELQNDYNNNEETFQVILYDPEFYPTISGNGDILFQYNTINNVDQGDYYAYHVQHGQYATVGIEDHTGTIGLEYTYNNSYPSAAEPLDDEMAILFTCSVINPLVLVPNSFYIEMESNQSLTDTLYLNNIGEESITYSINNPQHLGWISFSPASGELNGGETDEIEITFDSTNLQSGDYSCDLIIQTGTDYEIYLPVNLTVTETTVENDILPEKTGLYQNYPNPFNPATNIKFSLREKSNVLLEIYNIRGQKVKTLVNEQLNNGLHEISWDGRDEHQNSVASGIYFYKMKAGGFSSLRKMILMK